MHKIDFYTLGKQAFVAGKLRVPSLDGRLMDELKDLRVGLGAADMMAAWTQGWDVANSDTVQDEDDD